MPRRLAAAVALSLLCSCTLALNAPPPGTTGGPGPSASSVPTGSLAGTAKFPASVASGGSGYRVADLSQVPVAGATVKLLDAAGVVVATATTDASGNFTLSGVPVGATFKVEVSYTGGGHTYTEYGLAGVGTGQAASQTTVDAATTAAVLFLEQQAATSGLSAFTVNLATLGDLVATLSTTMTDAQAASLVAAPTTRTVSDTLAALQQADPTLTAKLDAAKATLSSAPVASPTPAGATAAPTEPPAGATAAPTETPTPAGATEAPTPTPTPAFYTNIFAGGAGNGSLTTGPATRAVLGPVPALAVDAANGKVYFYDYGTNALVRVVATAVDGSKVVQGYTVSPGIYNLGYDEVVAMAAASGRVYLLDTRYRLVWETAAAHGDSLDYGWNLLAGHWPPTTLDSADGVKTAAGFLAPKGLTMDGNGNLWTADNGALRKIVPSTGEVSTLGKGTFAGVVGLVYDKAGGFILSFDANGAKGPGLAHLDAAGIMTTPAGPTLTSLTLDGAGNLYGVGEGKLYRVAAGASYADAEVVPTGPVASFGSIAADADGNVYVADPSKHAIWRVFRL